jgi:hypothetical protein
MEAGYDGAVIRDAEVCEGGGGGLSAVVAQLTDITGN